MRAYVAMPDSEFMPKPGRLRELAFITPCRSLARYQRAAAAVRIADEPKPEPHDPKLAEAMRDDVKALLAEATAKLAKPESPKVRPNFAKVGEGGLSDGMRELLARRSA